MPLLLPDAVETAVETMGVVDCEIFVAVVPPAAAAAAAAAVRLLRSRKRLSNSLRKRSA